jgi:hypothetical protein
LFVFSTNCFNILEAWPSKLNNDCGCESEDASTGEKIEETQIENK